MGKMTKEEEIEEGKRVKKERKKEGDTNDRSM